MKTIQFLSVLFLLCSLAKAQDIIMKTDQTEVSAKVTEITSGEVKFKYFNRLDGPTYTLKKSEVFVIIYKDGTREKFTTTTAAPSSVPAASAITDTPTPRPVQPAYSKPAPATSVDGKRRGWAANLGYTTPIQSFGNLNGITYGFGYFFLGSGRRGGVLFDLDALDMFGEGTPNYGVLTANGIVRPSPASTFYVGGGIGYGTVSVKVKDRFGSSTTVSSGDVGGKIFMGYGLVRLGLVWPSLKGIDSGGLLTLGLSLNPFD